MCQQFFLSFLFLVPVNFVSFFGFCLLISNWKNIARLTHSAQPFLFDSMAPVSKSSDIYRAPDRIGFRPGRSREKANEKVFGVKFGEKGFSRCSVDWSKWKRVPVSLASGHSIEPIKIASMINYSFFAFSRLTFCCWLRRRRGKNGVVFLICQIPVNSSRTLLVAPSRSPDRCVSTEKF